MIHLTKERRDHAKEISYKAMVKLYPHRSLGNQYKAYMISAMNAPIYDKPYYTLMQNRQPFQFGGLM